MVGGSTSDLLEYVASEAHVVKLVAERRARAGWPAGGGSGGSQLHVSENVIRLLVETSSRE